MTDEETWERRWIKAVKTIAEREEVIDILKAERNRLEEMMHARPTGTRSQRESQLEKQVKRVEECLAEEREAWRRQIDELKKQLEEARAAVPHFYSPSTTHMGDCSICGNTQDAPQHDVKTKIHELEAQVKRLLAKDAEGIADRLERFGKEARAREREALNKRLDEPLPEVKPV